MSSSSSSSSSLLYINVLLLVLIHSSIQIGLPNNATPKATKRLLKAQDLKNRYLGLIVNTRNNINQKRAKMLKAHPKEQEILDNYMSCIISRKAKDLQRRLVKELANLEKSYEEQVSNYKYMNQFKLEEYYLSQLTENLKEPVSKRE
ncbi:hypothetical protein KSF78_0008426 [Schistosoma japonicum]|nr:hypothetical protein KSF78_0008426 [Schistosoma japonicum]